MCVCVCVCVCVCLKLAVCVSLDIEGLSRALDACLRTFLPISVHTFASTAMFDK